IEQASLTVVFLRGYSQHYSWERICEMHREVLEASALPVSILQNEYRFRDLLHDGIVQTAKADASLASMSHTEWLALAKFALWFFRECESCMPKQSFPEFFREAERRGPKQYGKGGLPEF